VTVACPTSTSFVNTGLSNGTTYYYVVSGAFSGNPNAGGESADSSEASATPQGIAPPVPTGLTATGGNAQVALAWNASSGATSYNVKRATTLGGPYTPITSRTSTSYTDAAVTNGTTYYYVVSAVNASGESGNSSEASATPQATAPAPPSGLTASTTPKPRQLVLRWAQSPTPGVTKNNVYRRTSAGSYPLSPTASINATTSYTDTGLTRGSTYCYVVTAVAGGLESAARSNEACATAK
jgi:cellulose 1,4-beta-cellobiosidase